VSDSPWILEVGEADFAEKVIEQSKRCPVVVDFWAPWCGPCRSLSPLLEKLTSEKNGEVILAKVDIDQNQRLAQEYQVESIPLVLAFKDGKVVLGFNGLLPESHLQEFYSRIMPGEADRQLKQAADLESQRPAEAEKSYRQILEKERDNAVALVGLARILIQRGEEQESAELLERVVGGEQAAEAEKLKNLLSLRIQAKEFGGEAGLQAKLIADPENAETRFQLGRVLAGAGKYPEALEMLLSAAQRDRQLATSKVREAMVQIFHVIGTRSEMADSYRDKLTKMLY
jgi:putative thioredoxin